MRFKFLTKLFLIFVLVLASVFAAGYANTLVMDKSGFNALLYKCGSDSSCTSPSFVPPEQHADTNTYTFNCNTDDYYAEYLFKVGYKPLGFIVHQYNGIDHYNFEKKDYCSAAINSVSVSDTNPDEGDVIDIVVNVRSAFQGQNPEAPVYKPNKYSDWFDADTRVVVQVMQDFNVIQEFTQEGSIYMNTNMNFNFQIDTSGLLGTYDIRVLTYVIDEICDQTNDVIRQSTMNINVVPQIVLQAPIAIAGPDMTVCLNSNVLFDGSNSYDPDGQIVTWSWNFGDGSAASGEIVNHAYAQIGTFDVLLTVTDNDNLQSQDNLVVTVNDCTANQPPIADAGPDQNANVNQNIVFDGSNSYDPDGQIVTWLWNFGDGSAASGEIVSHAYTQNGTYIVILTVTDNLGAQDSDTALVVIGSVLPQLTITADPEDGDAPLEVEFDAEVIGNGPFVYDWDFDDGSGSSQEDPTHTFDEAGEYDVELIVTDANGNTVAGQITITVNEAGDETETGKEHKLSIIHVSLNGDEFHPGDLINVNAEVKNTGDYTEKDIILKLLFTELGISESNPAFTLSPGNTQWESIELKIPGDAQAGLYNLRIELGNSHYIDTEYKVISVLPKENTEVLLDFLEEDGKSNKLFILEIVFVSLLILVLLTGIALLIRQIARIR